MNVKPMAHKKTLPESHMAGTVSAQSIRKKTKQNNR